MENENARVIKTGKVGKIVEKIQIGEIGTMFELAFEGEYSTACYWDSEVEIIADNSQAI